MEIKELREKLNKKHIKVRVPFIQGEAYAVEYARLLKSFTDNIVENFSGLVMAIFELTVMDFDYKAQDVPSLARAIDGFTPSERRFKIFKDENFNKSVRVLDSSPKNQTHNDKWRGVAHNDSMGNIITFDSEDDSEFMVTNDIWDNLFKEHEKEIDDIEKDLMGRKKRKSPDETKRAWKDLLKVITSEIAAKYPKKKKELVDYSSSLSSLFNYYTGRTELLAKKWTEEELNNLYRYVYGSYKKEFPNISVSAEYYEPIMNAVVSENLALIKSIPQEVLKEMQVVLSQGIISGNQKELVKNLKRIKGVQKDRAVFIARDQIHKAVEGFKQLQNTVLGIEYYEWLTAEDERVSSGIGGHSQNNHRIFKYGSNEAIISWSSKRGFYYGKPGDRPNCRCIAIGVILDTDEKIVKSSDGYGYQVVKK